MINIKSDSRKINRGDIFVALKGISSNGEDYVDEAIKRGASKIVVESDNKYLVDTLKVNNTRKYLNEYLNHNYSKVLSDMKIIGLTGTNGKTTTCYLVYQILNLLGYKCGYIGTVGFYLDKKISSLPNTSPDICELYDMITTSYELGYKYIVMEASSQGLDMGRFSNIKFDIAAFTNLTQDHLDYHKTFENYAKAKQILFKKLKNNGISILNSDDKYYNYFLYGNIFYYGLNGNDYKISNIKLGYKTEFNITIDNKIYNVESNLLGEYNIYNLVCAIAIVNKLNIDIDSIISTIKKITTPPGRMDLVRFKDNLIIIDYAHTPDAMKNIYDTVNKIKKGNVYTIFGCTGDRDRTKRPLMLSLALNNSIYSIITSDDLHNEEFDSIIKDMFINNKKNNYSIVKDRAEAIKRGMSLLKHNDILLLLGKGHEEFIIVKDKKIPFNDKNEVLKIINESKSIKI